MLEDYPWHFVLRHWVKAILDNLEMLLYSILAFVNCRVVKVLEKENLLHTESLQKLQNSVALSYTNYAIEF